MDRRQLKILPCGGVLHSAQNQIFVWRAGKFRAAGHSAAASDRTTTYAGLHRGSHREIQFESQPEAIEARAEIRRRSRHTNLKSWTLGISHGEHAIYRRRSSHSTMA